MFSYDSLCNRVLYVHEKTCYLIRVQAQVIRSFMLLIVPCHLITLLLKTVHDVERLFLCMPDMPGGGVSREQRPLELQHPGPPPRALGQIIQVRYPISELQPDQLIPPVPWPRATKGPPLQAAHFFFFTQDHSCRVASMIRLHSLPALCVCASTDV